MGQLDDLTAKWNDGSITASAPGELRLKTPSGDVVVVAGSAGDGVAELKAVWNGGSLASDAAALEGLAQAAMLMRSSLLRCSVAGGGIEIRMPVYLEGISRQEFLGAVGEVGRTYWLIASSAAELIAQREAGEKTKIGETELMDILAEVQQAQLDLDALVEESARVPSGAAGWAATHAAPEGGMPAWTSPDPSVAPAVFLASGVELQVGEQRGEWAHVTGSNGWSGWVDVRRLVARS